MTLFRKQSGITLIELMIAMILGLIVSGAIITIFITNIKSATENIKMIHLNQELRTVMGFMSDEIKRAGYSASSDENYMKAWSTSGCIIYAYDQNGDGSTYAAGTDRLGFKLDNGVIKWGRSVTSCTLPAANWQPLTDIDTANITLFTFPSPPIVAGTLNIRQVTITITGETSLNPGTATRKLTETIRVRNEDDT